MHTGTVVRKFAGHKIAEPFLDKVLAAYGDCIGMAFVQGEGVFVQSQAAAMDKENLVAFQEEFLSTEVLFFFGKGEFQENDVQPFPLLTIEEGENSRNILAATLEGNFKSYEQPGTPYSPEFHAMERVVKPKIETLWTISDGDIDAFWKSLLKPGMEKQFLDMMQEGRGELTFLCANGDFKVLAKENNLGGTFEWGVASNALSYKEGGFPEKEKKVQPLPTMRARTATSTVATPVAAKTQPPAPAAPAAAKEGARATVLHAPPAAVAAAKTDTMIEIPQGKFACQQVPRGWDSKKSKQWFEKHMGRTPQGWHDLVKRGSWFKVKVIDQSLPVQFKPPKDFHELAGMLGIPEPVDAKDKAGAAKAAADITVDTFKKNVEPKKSSGAYPLIPEGQFRDFNSKFMSGEPFMNPATIQELEFREKSFTEHTNGRDAREPAHWTRDRWWDAITNYRETAFHAILAVTAMLHKYAPTESLKLPEKKAAEAPPPAEAPASKKKVVQPLPPARKAG